MLHSTIVQIDNLLDEREHMHIVRTRLQTYIGSFKISTIVNVIAVPEACFIPVDYLVSHLHLSTKNDYAAK